MGWSLWVGRGHFVYGVVGRSLLVAVRRSLCVGPCGSVALHIALWVGRSWSLGSVALCRSLWVGHCGSVAVGWSQWVGRSRSVAVG